MFASPEAVRIVLVRSRNPLNIGAAARAMKNFGFEDLVLVATHGPVWEESRAAPGAQELLKKAGTVPHLLEAIEDRTLVLATSALARRKTPSRVIALNQLSDFLKQREGKDRAAILFGSEKTGLRNQELDYCHAVIRIPTTAECPSMNLGQSVAVCCYEIRRLLGLPPTAPATEVPRATVGEVARLANEIEKLLLARPKTAGGRESTRVARLRTLLLHGPLTSQDVTFVLGILRDLTWRLHGGATAGQLDRDG